MIKIIKYLNFFFIFFLSFSEDAKTLELPEVTAEYVCNTKFIIGVNVLETRTFRGKNKKRIDTVIKNVPQSVIIDYEKQTASWVWPKTSSYLSVPLKKENQENLKKATNIVKLKKIKSDYIHGFAVDLYELEANLPDGTKEESTRWITKHGVTLKEVGSIEGTDGKLHFYSEFSNVKVFKQDERLFEVPSGYKIAPMEDLDDINELLKTMVKRS
jgi:hypothetical protein